MPYSFRTSTSAVAASHEAKKTKMPVAANEANMTADSVQVRSAAPKLDAVNDVNSSAEEAAALNDARAKMRRDIKRRLATISAKQEMQRRQHQQQVETDMSAAGMGSPQEYRHHYGVAESARKAAAAPNNNNVSNNVSTMNKMNSVATKNPTEYKQDINPRDVYYKQVRSRISTFRSGGAGEFRHHSAAAASPSRQQYQLPKKSFTMMENYHENARSRSIELRGENSMSIAVQNEHSAVHHRSGRSSSAAAADTQRAKWHVDPLRSLAPSAGAAPSVESSQRKGPNNSSAMSGVWIDQKEEVFMGRTPRSVLLKAEAIQKRSASAGGENVRRHQPQPSARVAAERYQQQQTRSLSAQAEERRKVRSGKEIPEANDRVKQLAVPLVHNRDSRAQAARLKQKRQQHQHQLSMLGGLAPHPSGNRPLRARQEHQPQQQEYMDDGNYEDDDAAAPRGREEAPVPTATATPRGQGVVERRSNHVPNYHQQQQHAAAQHHSERGPSQHTERAVSMDLDTSGDTPARQQQGDAHGDVTPPDSPYQALSPPSEVRPSQVLAGQRQSYNTRPEGLSMMNDDDALITPPPSGGRGGSNGRTDPPKNSLAIPFHIEAATTTSTRISRPDLFQGHHSANPIPAGPYPFRSPQQVDSASRELLAQMQHRQR